MVRAMEIVRHGPALGEMDDQLVERNVEEPLGHAAPIVFSARAAARRLRVAHARLDALDRMAVSTFFLGSFTLNPSELPHPAATSGLVHLMPLAISTALCPFLAQATMHGHRLTALIFRAGKPTSRARYLSLVGDMPTSVAMDSVFQPASQRQMMRLSRSVRIMAIHPLATGEAQEASPRSPYRRQRRDRERAPQA
jgi:hypothetical protein